MKKNILFETIAIAGCVSVLYADIITINEVGVGARAYSFANNYVALSNDMSGIFWNPAALSFLPVREFQISTEGLTNTNTTDFFGTSQKSDVRRFRMTNAGFLTALPTSRGGLTFAGAFQSPYIFDNNPSFHGSYINTFNEVVQDEDTYRGYGNLNYWSGAFGMQVAPGLGVGGALSLVTGTEKIKHSFLKLTSGVIVNSVDDDYNDTKERDYLGYDLRAGLLYSFPNKKVRIGARLVIPQTIWFDESSTFSGSYKGQLNSSFSGAIGVAGVLPFMTLSSEVRLRAPYDFINPDEAIPTTSPAHDVKTGAGIGAEIPLSTSNFLVRLGFSWDQYDLYEFAMKYDNEPTGIDTVGDLTGWSTSEYGVTKDRKLLTAGIAYVLSNASFEASYGYQSWGLSVFKGIRDDSDHLQRFILSMSFRF
jgi:hypothetical protein